MSPTPTRGPRTQKLPTNSCWGSLMWLAVVKSAHERGKLRLQSLTTQACPCHSCHALQGGYDYLLERRSENDKLENLICARPPARLSPYMISLDSQSEAGTMIPLNSHLLYPREVTCPRSQAILQLIRFLTQVESPCSQPYPTPELDRTLVL